MHVEDDNISILALNIQLESRRGNTLYFPRIERLTETPEPGSTSTTTG